MCCSNPITLIAVCKLNWSNTNNEIQQLQRAKRWFLSKWSEKGNGDCASVFCWGLCVCRCAYGRTRWLGSEIHWLERQDPTRNCTLSVLDPLFPSLPVLPGLPWCCKDNLGPGPGMPVEMYPVPLCRLINAFHPQWQSREVCLAAGWAQTRCTGTNCGCSLSADRAFSSLSVMTYYSLGWLSYNFQKGMLMSCTSWKTHF